MYSPARLEHYNTRATSLLCSEHTDHKPREP